MAWFSDYKRRIEPQQVQQRGSSSRGIFGSGGGGGIFGSRRRKKSTSGGGLGRWGGILGKVLGAGPFGMRREQPKRRPGRSQSNLGARLGAFGTGIGGDRYSQLPPGSQNLMRRKDEQERLWRLANPNPTPSSNSLKGLLGSSPIQWPGPYDQPSPWGADLGQQIGGYAGGVQPLGQMPGALIGGLAGAVQPLKQFQEPRGFRNMFQSAGLGY